ncbi:hypothetical protein B0H14DRAFT_3519517 [Mycena olivaceomarginata]|nr:hypothetical protein B0H14DRAFT_3519517 [Mycena olivaceomarginata]
MDVQCLFIPEVTATRARGCRAHKHRRNATTAGNQAQNTKLWLPSSIGVRIACYETLQDYEYQLQKGQVAKALKEMCDGLLLRTHKYQYCDSVQGIKAKTRSGMWTNGIQAQVDSVADKYWEACAALVKLGAIVKRSDWAVHFKELKPENAGSRRRGRAGSSAGRGQVTHVLDLAVRGSSGAAEDVIDNEVLWIEGAKTRAKAMRYAEEVDLLKEEMWHVLQLLQWRGDWWRSLLGLRAEQQLEPLCEEHAAYIHKPEVYMDKLRTDFEMMWKDVPALLKPLESSACGKRMQACCQMRRTKRRRVEEQEGEEEGGACSGWLSD